MKKVKPIDTVPAGLQRFLKAKPPEKRDKAD